MTADEDGTVTAVNRHGATITIDANGERGFTPVEMLLAALGSCGAVDMVELMRKQRAPVTPLAVEVEGEKGEHAMEWLRVTYRPPAPVDQVKLERARSKTAEDLCTVSRTLVRSCPVEHAAAAD